MAETAPEQEVIAMNGSVLNRRRLLAAIGALGAAGVVGRFGTAAGIAAATSRRPRSAGRATKGVNYDTGIEYLPGYSSRTVWREELVARELAAIRDDLGCDAVILNGTSPARLEQAARLATDLGLTTWLGVRAPELTPEATRALIVEVAELAAAKRAIGSDVGLIVGCELTVFMSGLVPGADLYERAASLSLPDAAGWDGRLDDYLAGVLTAVRARFDGPITYAAGTWESIDWTPFDVVGSNLYRYEGNESTYVDDVRRLFEHGRPVMITEFGCASYVGAAAKGPNGDDIVDWSAPQPVLVGNPVRDEGVQADYITELLDVFDAEGVDGAFVFEFIETAMPYSADPTRDLDMAGHAIVKVDPPGSPNAYDTTGAWTPKQAFHALATR